MFSEIVKHAVYMIYFNPFIPLKCVVFPDLQNNKIICFKSVAVRESVNGGGRINGKTLLGQKIIDL
jgi:hypothetical protein